MYWRSRARSSRAAGRLRGCPCRCPPPTRRTASVRRRPRRSAWPTAWRRRPPTPTGGPTSSGSRLGPVGPAPTAPRSWRRPYPRATPEERAGRRARRNLGFRTRVVQLMVLDALVLRPLPPEVVDRVDEFSRALGVEEGMLAVAHEFARGSLGLAAIDFDRNGYTHDWGADAHRELHTARSLAGAWEVDAADPELAARWAALESLPEGSLGRGVWQLYAARGFVYPGLPGSAPVLLAQHDWVHVLADFGTTVESELEVFALISRASDDMRAFSL